MVRRTAGVRLAGTLVVVALLSGCGSSPANVSPAPAAGRAGQTPVVVTAAQAPPGAEGTPLPKSVPTDVATQPAPRLPASADAPNQNNQPTTSAAGIPAAAQPAVDRARADLAQQQGVAVEMIEVLGVRQQYRSTGASDSPGRADGWQILLAVRDTRYSYHVDAQGKLSRAAPRE